MQASPDVQIPPPPSLPGRVVLKAGVNAPQAVYRAFNEQRKELGRQLEQLENKRSDLTNRLSGTEGQNAAPVGRAGLEARIAEIDKRIGDVDKQLAAADQQVATAAAVPGAIVEEPRESHHGPTDGELALGGLFIVVVFFPLSAALARRIWKRGAAAVAAFPQDLVDRLNRLDHSMDSVAIEVERIGEGQRFITRVLSENGRALGVGAAQPVDVGSREKARVQREGERG